MTGMKSMGSCLSFLLDKMWPSHDYNTALMGTPSLMIVVEVLLTKIKHSFQSKVRNLSVIKVRARIQVTGSAADAVDLRKKQKIQTL